MTDKTQQMDLMPEAGSDAAGPVECLGQTFPSDAARRDHYLTRLRAALEELNARLGGVTWTTVDDAVTRLSSLEHWQFGDRLRELAERMREAARGQGRGKDLLQLWKDEVGFPHGEMDDILRLSDPPYYTACPNPFIGEFIAYYGKPYDPTTSDYRREPFAADVSEGKNDPIYNAHSYHTKVPHKAIMRYILHYTEPGDIVFDGFSGTGMTGVAAAACGDELEITELGYSVDKNNAVVGTNGEYVGQVGRRAAILNDLSPYASFITFNYSYLRNLRTFSLEAYRVIAKVEKELDWLYQHQQGRVLNGVWSDVFLCPNCGQEFIFWNAAITSGTVTKSFGCPHCGIIVGKAASKSTGAVKLERAYEARYEPLLGRTIKSPKFILVEETVIQGKARKRIVADSSRTSDLAARIANYPPVASPTDEFFPGRQTNKLRNGTGIHHVFQMYTPRALLVYSSLWQQELSTPARTALFRFCLSSINNYISRKQGYFGGGGGVPNTLFTPSIHLERNVFDVLKRKIKQLAQVRTTGTNTNMVSTQSITNVFTIPSKSVDYIFTDPPFGESIQYSELNLFVEAWLRMQSSNVNDAVLNYVHKKDLAFYSEMMARAFSEYARILKPGRWITIVFHNSQNAVWSAIQQAIESASLIVADVRVLDKQQRSFNAVNRAGAVDQDLVISAYKPNGGLEDRFRLEAGTENGVWDFVRTHLRQLPVFVSKDGQVEVIAERQNYLLFDRMVAFHVQRGVTVPLSAAEFYAGLEQRFSERDGMYFLPEQVAEYDKKRMTATEVMQLTLFVTDEASAIQWLKQQLTKKPQTFQDLHPQFMRQIGGWSKHELSLELRDLLEQNFLVYDGTGEVPSQIHAYLSSNYKDLRNLAKDDPRLREEAADRWYVPDPNKAGDLEKLRERALLREFAEYRESKQRKLKVFRLEAVRAGFKKAWGERDYATILAVAEKIPDAVLQEDPKLLMWYDQALTRSGK